MTRSTKLPPLVVPPDWIPAIDAAAEAKGVTRADWIRKRLLLGLPPETRKMLSTVLPAHRPKSPKEEETGETK